MNDCVSQCLKSSGYKAKDIDILIVNCSLFSPTPSLCAMIINDFGMRSDILSYNLSGMGCSAGVISVDLAKRLMLGRPNSLALVVSTENLTQALYLGNDRAFLLQNTLFRCGKLCSRSFDISVMDLTFVIMRRRGCCADVQQVVGWVHRSL